MDRRIRALAAALVLALGGLTGVGGPAAAEVSDPSPVGEPKDQVAAGTAAVAAGGSIAGTVTAPAGTDLTMVSVYVHPEPGSTTSGYAQVGADGSYTAGGLAPGSYVVEFVGWSVGLVHEYWNDSLTYGQATKVAVGAGPVTGVDAALARGATISGVITTSSDCDLTEVDVRAHNWAGMTLPDGIVQPDGRWSVTGLPPGRFQVEFEGRWAGLNKVWWIGPQVEFGRSYLTLAAEQVVTGIDARLEGPTSGCVALRPYVTAVYEDLLGRRPDPMGLVDWTNAIAWGTPHAAVANGITASDEFRSTLIRGAYADYLGRDADHAGLMDWLAQMRTGRHIESIEAGFIASDEFYARHGGTPAGWVTGLYQTVLGREPAASEVHEWVARMSSGADRLAVAAGFLYSTEHLTAVIDAYYVHLLGRHIDAVGRADWVRLIQGGHRDEEIIAGIVASPEYMARAARR